MKDRAPIAIVVILTAAGFLTGCIMPDQFAQLQKDLQDVKQQIGRIEAEQTTARERLQSLQEAATRSANQGEQAARDDLADLNFRMDQATRDAAETDRRLLDLSQRVERLGQRLDRPRVDQGTVPGAPRGDTGSTRPGEPRRSRTGSAADAEELYNTAYADFSKGNYDLAIAGFLEFHQTYPNSSQADNALYWVGECKYSQGEFRQAIEAFDRLLEAFPDSDKAASGDLKKGLAYLEQNDVGKAIVQFQHVHDRYAGTDEARVARDRLSALGVSI